jgi:purine-binding chemotaxis protein CheW
MELNEREAPAATLLDAIAASDAQLDAAAAAAPASAPETPLAPAPAERFVLLSIASSQYAIAEAFVTELERTPKITPVPRVPAWLRGVTNLRGDILSVIDLRVFLRIDGPPSLSTRLLVVRLPHEELSTGLLVDAVDRIVTVPAGAIAPPASPLEGPLAAYLRGVCRLHDRIVAVLDLERLLRSAEIRQFDDPKDVFTDKD